MKDKDKIIENLVRDNKMLDRENRKLIETLFELTGKTAVGKWILCDEQMPVKNGWYLATAIIYSGEPVVMLARCENKEWHKYFHKEIDIVAWMPLPPAYEPLKKEPSEDWEETMMKNFMKVE